MSSQPLVSVVLPVRDGGEFLAAAVDSILGQSHVPLELLVVDDHSRDSAVEALSIDDPRLSVLPSPGAGVSAAFNHGLTRARGDFIARMDADDIAHPGRLALQIEYLRGHPEIDFCGGQVRFFPDPQVAEGNRRYARWLNRLVTPADIRRALFIESPIPNPTAMFRRSALERLGGYHDPDWPEDYDLFLRADALGMKMGKPEGVVLDWREHPRRLTRCSERYARSRFQQAKAHYLARGRLANAGPVVIWGAGPSGVEMHDLVVEQGVEVAGFIEVHPRRVGGHKREKPVWGIDYAAQGHCPFVIVAVGSRGARAEIRRFMRQAGRIEAADFLFVA